MSESYEPSLIRRFLTHPAVAWPVSFCIGLYASWIIAEWTKMDEIEKTFKIVKAIEVKIDGISMDVKETSHKVDEVNSRIGTLHDSLVIHHAHAKMKFSCLDSLNRTSIYQNGVIIRNLNADED